jgi:hypothetical protein
MELTAKTMELTDDEKKVMDLAGQLIGRFEEVTKVASTIQEQMGLAGLTVFGSGLALGYKCLQEDIEKGLVEVVDGKVRVKN